MASPLYLNLWQERGQLAATTHRAREHAIQEIADAFHDENSNAELPQGYVCSVVVDSVASRHDWTADALAEVRARRADRRR